MLGEMKYVATAHSADLARLMHEVQDYLSISSESTSDWGHDFALGLLYEYGGKGARRIELNLDHWVSERIAFSIFRGGG